MSINRNRSKLKKAKTGKEYLAIQYNIKYPPYYEDMWRFYPVYNWGTSKYRKKYWKKQKCSYQMRMYKTWKYNRKNQWKE